MKVTINEIPVTLACSEAGKQALNTAEMTLRQRQFILLIKENTSLGEQAVSNLLSNTKPNNYSIAHFRAVRDLMVSTCLAKLHQA